MYICLSHWTALECWRRIRQSGTALTEILLSGGNAPLSQGTNPSVTSREAQRLAEHLNLSLPLQLYLPNRIRRNAMEKCHFLRQRKCEPPINAYELEDGVFLPRPEEVFMQLSGLLGAIDRFKLAYELMSSYTVSESELQPALPLFTREQMLAESLRWPKNRQDMIRRCMANAMPGAESPAETNLALKLFLPMRYGGLGMRGAQLNPQIKLSQEGQALTGKNHCRADIFFADIKLDIEYDSTRWHSTEMQQLDDLRRRLALKRDGYEVIPIDAQTANNREKLNLLASEIAARQNTHINLTRESFILKQATLFKQLGPFFTPVQRF